MCGGGGGDDGTDFAKEQAAKAEQKEAERQAAIQQGLAAIDAMFNGGQYLTGYTTQQVLNPAYSAGGLSAFNRTPQSGYLVGPGASGLQKLSAAYNANPAAFWTGDYGDGMSGASSRASNVPKYLTKQVPTYAQGQGFGDDFYNNKAKAYADFYMPQLERQYGDAKDQLTYGLANAGTLRSSIANKENSDLYRQRLEQETGIRERGQAEATRLRQQVAAEKQALISQLMVSADPNLAANQAAASAAMLRAPSNDYDVLGDVFKQALVGGGNLYQGYNQGNMTARYPIPSAYGSGSSKTYG